MFFFIKTFYDNVLSYTWMNEFINDLYTNILYFILAQDDVSMLLSYQWYTVWGGVFACNWFIWPFGCFHTQVIEQ